MKRAKTILVLEDDEARVAWLRRQFEQWCFIEHAPTVGAFLDAQRKAHDLVIFDHDLDLTHTGGYDDPKPTGLTAARAYRGRAPALVWSWNDGGAHQICLALRSKGSNTRAYRFDGTVKLAALIATAVSGDGVEKE